MPLTENQEEEMKSLFTKYAKDGSIGKNQIGNACRAGGLNPTEADLQLWKGEAARGLDLQGFTRFMGTKFDETNDCVDEIVESFQAFDTNGVGTISVTELKVMLTTMGEKMTTAEVQTLLDECDLEDGKVSYLQLSHMLIGTYYLLYNIHLYLYLYMHIYCFVLCCAVLCAMCYVLCHAVPYACSCHIKNKFSLETISKFPKIKHCSYLLYCL